MISKILDTILLVGRMVRALVARINAAKQQKARDELHDDPAAWFDDHFCGLCDDDIENQATETEPDD